MNITKCKSGAWEIYALHKDVLVSRIYCGYTKTESVQMFRELLRSL
jgi:hypothetical protein